MQPMATTARSKNINGRVARRVILAPANTRALPPNRARISLVHIKRRFIQQPPPARKSNSGLCRVAFKRRLFCASKRRLYSEDGAMEQDGGFGLWVGCLAEVVDVTIGSEATDNGGTRRGVDCEALGADGDFAVVADPD